MTEKRFDYEYNHNILAYILTDNGEEITSFDAEGVSDEDIKIIIDLLNEKEERIRELEKENERLKEKEEYCDNICKSFGDYYGMNIENAEWFGFNGDV